jgi:hypothetical protein
MQCFECGELDNLHMHHVVPRSRGGTRTVPLCAECHGKAHHRKRAMTTGALTAVALRAKRARGECTGNAPFGYVTRPDGRLAPRASEIDVARAAVEARERGLSTRQIAADLTERGWRSRNGGPISHTAVQRMLNFARAAEEP